MTELAIALGLVLGIMGAGFVAARWIAATGETKAEAEHGRDELEAIDAAAAVRRDVATGDDPRDRLRDDWRG